MNIWLLANWKKILAGCLAVIVGGILLIACAGLGVYALTRTPPTQEPTQVSPTESPETPDTPIPEVFTPFAPAAPATSGCPTTADAKVATNVDLQRIGTETCAFVWRGAPGETTTAICPSGYVCTFDVVNDITVVHLGVNQKAIIRAGTWRFIAAYPPSDAVHDVCSLYQKEKAFGLSEVPSFEVRFQAVTDGSFGPFGPQSCP